MATVAGIVKHSGNKVLIHGLCQRPGIRVDVDRAAGPRQNSGKLPGQGQGLTDERLDDRLEFRGVRGRDEYPVILIRII